MPIALSERNPRVTPEKVLAGLRPPPAFAHSTLAGYRPVPSEPSQQHALDQVSRFASTLTQTAPTRPQRRRWVRRQEPPAQVSGLYLDGGFGVGKTHLLAGLWHAAPGHKLFATFVELTHLVGALGFAEAVERLSSYRLVCIDEFELDDPGDTVLVSTLLARLREAGVRVAATSNTLPGRLGEGRFATADFMREIQGLAESFHSVRIDGPDYRHRDLPAAPEPPSLAEVERVASRAGASFDHFVDLTRHLADLHPSKYGALLDDVEVVCLEDVRTVEDQAVALRLVVLADRMYDRNLPVVASGVSFDELFAPALLTGGYRKKYHRAVSRLVALAREGYSIA